ncbi:MAG: OmpH family outer membrane protein [Bacteroidales bacterium]|jgi:outer membrane protein|nr:OmpH family outer membrane protein [Bacteroidales bacterium]
MDENIEQKDIQQNIMQETGCGNTKEAITKLHKKTRYASIIAIISLLVSVVLIIGVMFCHKDKTNSDNQSKVVAKTIQNGSLKIAYINTDTIMAKYEYAKDMEASLKAYQQQIENQLRSAGQQFQKDYEDYMKNGANLTLTKQKEKEKELTQRQQELPALQQEMAVKLQERQFNDNKKLVDAIYAFIDEYNKTHDKFNVILRKEYMNSPVLYIDKGFDITDEIIKGLNEEYKKVKQQ